MLWVLPMLGWLRRLIGAKDTREIEERLDELDKSMRSLQEDWTDVYGKFRVLQMRVAKQVQRLDANSSPEEAPEQSVSPEGAPGPGLTLSPHQRGEQKQIMDRRHARVCGGEWGGAPRG